MPRCCSVCVHRERSAIETALSTTLAVREIGSSFGLSRSALSRHRLAHMGRVHDDERAFRGAQNSGSAALADGGRFSTEPELSPSTQNSERATRPGSPSQNRPVSLDPENRAEPSPQNWAEIRVKRYRSRWR